MEKNKELPQWRNGRRAGLRTLSLRLGGVEVQILSAAQCKFKIQNLKLFMFIPQDFIDHFSIPEKVIKTKLTVMFQLKVRKIKEKPGRSLTVLYDKRNPLSEKFKVNYSYIVDIKKEKFAGGRYHKIKKEFFFPVNGKFLVILVDIKTNRREKIYLKRSYLLYVPPLIAHKVYCKEGGSLLVLASYFESERDEFKFEM